VTLVQITTQMNLDSAVCSACGGACCKNQPGITAPAQWGASSEEIETSLTEAFKTGTWAIDWWQGDTESDGDLEEVFFIRPAAVGVDALYHGAAYDRRCVFLGDNGCRLTPETRPDGCLLLVPNDDHSECLPGPVRDYKITYARQWRAYQKEIVAAAHAVGRDFSSDFEEDEVYSAFSVFSW
jgi:hypothetical protein